MAQNSSIIDQIKEKEKESTKKIDAARVASESQTQKMKAEFEQKGQQLEETLGEEKTEIIETTKTIIKSKKEEFEKQQSSSLAELYSVTDKKIQDAATAVVKKIVEA